MDPLLDEQARRHGHDDDRLRPPPYGRRRATVALGLVGLVAAALLAASLVTDDDDSGALPATTHDGRRQQQGAATNTPGDPTTTSSAAPTMPPDRPSPTAPSIDEPGSLWWVVNKDRPMPANYVPPDLVTPDVPLEPDTDATRLDAATAAAFEDMVAEAATAGYQLQLTSGYRSSDQQQALYDRSVQDYGPEVAAQRVALPGTSEHETGLAADVGLVGLPDDQEFGSTEASAWVADNGHHFGFILRYPEGKEQITGYSNEPWHLRYVGVELATELHRSGLTMEEHFGLV